jgi:hypothetical protein
MCAPENNITEATKVAILLREANEKYTADIELAVMKAKKAMKQGEDK